MRGAYQEIYVNGTYKGDAATNGQSVTVTVKEQDKITTKSSSDPFDAWWTTKGQMTIITTSSNLTVYGGDYPDGMGFSARFREDY